MKIDLEKIKSKKSVKELLEFSLINVDKPSGPTSFTVSHFIKNLLEARKTSHLGTLDPMVSGILPIGINRACRLNEYLMHRDKVYIGIMRLHEDKSDAEVKKVIKQFLGKITQLPPVRSRVKRAERVREVKTFEIKERDGKDILFETQVEAGTYIRKLIHDMGLELGGAHMLELRRTSAGIFTEPAYTLYELEEAFDTWQTGKEESFKKMLIPGEIIGTILKPVFINDVARKKCSTGSPLFKEFIISSPKLEKEEKIAVFCEDIFVGCYRVVNEGTILAVPEFVLN